MPLGSQQGAPVTTRLLSRHGGDDRGTEVLRASFRDGRLARIEYESFADEYHHLVKRWGSASRSGIALRLGFGDPAS